MEERIKSIYNDCARSFNKYLSDHDMAAYNKRSLELIERYDGKNDIVNLLLWFAPVVNQIHEEYIGG